jgi:hypothetical protein
MRPVTSMSIWIPALRAGMTEIALSADMERIPSASLFQRSAFPFSNPRDPLAVGCATCVHIDRLHTIDK